MKKKEILRLFTGLQAVKHLAGVKFAYAVMKNLKMLEAEVQALREASKPPHEYVKYDKRRIEICQEFCDKDEQGNPVLKDGIYVFSGEKQGLFDEGIEALKEVYADELKTREEQIKEVEKLLDEDIIFTPHLVKDVNLPEGITAQQLLNIQEIITEE